ncbi:hypothetical protein PTNB73_06841 [Pyrenophora teres f. teres]|nr:hypothetical protein PTNB73_06841 [Pyrenophora teres f. teres]
MSFLFGRKQAPPPPPVIPPPIPRSGPEIDATTVASLLTVLALLGGAYGVSVKVLPKKTTALKTRVLFIWHLFDALIHFVFEGSFLWNCFFVTYSLPTTFSAASRNPLQITLFTPQTCTGLAAKICCMEQTTGPVPSVDYGKTLEILTVFVAGPLACWICYLLTKGEKKGVLKKWFWMTVLATGEIYGANGLTRVRGFFPFSGEPQTACENRGRWPLFTIGEAT